MITITTIIITLYIILIRIFRTGWKSIEVFYPKDFTSGNEISISVIVACKNEEKTLPHLIQSLQNQSFKSFELILVNDHSTDSTQKIIEESFGDFQNAIYINSEGNGKKLLYPKG